MSKQCVSRLQKELKMLTKNPNPQFTASPEADQLLLWYFVVEGPADTPYAGGRYVGKVRFPTDYPFKPPTIMMITPTGRFKTEERLCLSMSDFHPETWNPMWHVETIILGLISFMTEDEITAGSIKTTDEEKKRLAAASHKFNAELPVVQRLFPEHHEAAMKSAGLA